MTTNDDRMTARNVLGVNQHGPSTSHLWIIAAIVVVVLSAVLMRPFGWWMWSTFLEPYIHPHPLILGMILDASTVCMLTLVAVWSVASSRNWTFRALILVVTPLIVLPIRAYELVIRFACFELTLAAGVWLVTQHRQAKCEAVWSLVRCRPRKYRYPPSCSSCS